MLLEELLKYLWSLSRASNDDEMEMDKPIHMENLKLDRRARSLRRRRKQDSEISSYSANTFLVVPGGVNALLPLFFPMSMHTKSPRPLRQVPK